MSIVSNVRCVSHKTHYLRSQNLALLSQKIIYADVSFDCPEFGVVSREAVQFLRRLLNKDPLVRILHRVFSSSSQPLHSLTPAPSVREGVFA